MSLELVVASTAARLVEHASDVGIGGCVSHHLVLTAAGIVVNATGLTKVDSSASSVIDPVTTTTSDRDFRYDASLAGYIYNLKTTGFTTGTWALTFTTIGDGVSHTVLFDLR
jgi:hypothetical protein